MEGSIAFEGKAGGIRQEDPPPRPVSGRRGWSENRTPITEKADGEKQAVPSVA